MLLDDPICPWTTSAVRYPIAMPGLPEFDCTASPWRGSSLASMAAVLPAAASGCNPGLPAASKRQRDTNHSTRKTLDCCCRVWSDSTLARIFCPIHRSSRRTDRWLKMQRESSESLQYEAWIALNALVGARHRSIRCWWLDSGMNIFVVMAMAAI